MIDWIREQLAANQFAQGAVMATVLGGLMAYCKQVPSVIMKFLRRRFLTSISVNDTSEDLKYFLKWATSFKSFKSIKQLNVFGNRVHSGSGYGERGLVVPASGIYFGWIKYRPVWLRISHTKSQQGTWNWDIELSSFSWTKGFMEGLNEEFRKSIPNHKADKIKIYSCSGGDKWNGAWTHRFRQKRPKESIFYNGTIREDIFKDVASFIKDKDWYFKRGIPHKRAYLFESKPGTGKTSLAMAIASEIDRDLFIVNLSEFKGDAEFGQAWREIDKGSIVLLEDIDAQNFNLQRDDRAPDKVSLAAVLNALDGSDYLEDSIIIVTTNRPEVLDEAFIREGRIDRKWKFDYFTFQTAIEMSSHFLESEVMARDFVVKHFGEESGCYIKPAALQEKLMSCKR